MHLSTDIRDAGFVYKIKAKKLERLGIYTLEDLLLHVPFRYEDYDNVSRIIDLEETILSTIVGEVIEIKNQYTRSRFTLQKVDILDESGSIECLWFNQPYLTKVIKKGDKISLVGKLDNKGPKRVFQVKDYEIIIDQSKPIHTQGMVAIYPETRGLSSKWIRNRIYTFLKENTNDTDKFLPEYILDKYEFMPYYKALYQIHFPDSIKSSEKAREMLSFQELFFLHLGALSRRDSWEKKKAGLRFETKKHKNKIDNFIKALPFNLTGAQNRAIENIFDDLNSKIQMNRLLEGDVGSGKTVVATIAMYLTSLNNLQSLLMAPTEILATQHYKTISELLVPLGLSVGLFTSSNKPKGSADQFDIAIGTHSLLNKKVSLSRLGLVVVDEQQKFGVKQRTILREKGSNSHFLTMTATPIPRTVFLTLYGDLKLSVLDEMPKGRKKIKTWLVPPEKRGSAYKWIESKIMDYKKNGKTNQAFIICPFIEESESSTTVKAATTEYKRLKNEIFNTLNLGLLHGKLKANEKTKALSDFRDGKSDILVSTPVVEVGIDIPTATIILIETAERFGLAQLHQLRGRVGRGKEDSYCLLFSDSSNNNILSRLKSLEKTHTGPELAEIDLKLRGPGDMYGTKQHGSVSLKVASSYDGELMKIARDASEEIFSKLSRYKTLQDKLNSIIIHSVAPD